jgi:hypothetical protein
VPTDAIGALAPAGGLPGGEPPTGGVIAVTAVDGGATPALPTPVLPPDSPAALVTPRAASPLPSAMGSVVPSPTEPSASTIAKAGSPSRWVEVVALREPQLSASKLSATTPAKPCNRPIVRAMKPPTTTHVIKRMPLGSFRPRSWRAGSATLPASRGAVHLGEPTDLDELGSAVSPDPHSFRRRRSSSVASSCSRAN